MENKHATSSHNNIKEWVSLYSDDLFRWALHRINDKETAEDLVQETFLAAFKSIDKFQGNSQPKTWLFSIINNKIIDFHRKNFREATINTSSIHVGDANNKDVLENFFDEDGTWKPEVRPSDQWEMDEHLLDNLEFTKVLQNCMEELPENWYSAIHFKYLEEKGGKEICQELGITSSNYWKMLQRAKLQLKMCLENSWFKLNDT